MPLRRALLLAITVLLGCAEDRRLPPAPSGPRHVDASAASNDGAADLDSGPVVADDGSLEDGSFEDGSLPASDAGFGFDATPIGGDAAIPSGDAGPRACSISGAGCATSANCCGGLVCTGGQCRVPAPSCGPAGDTCAAAGDCCPGLVCSASSCAVCFDDRLACTRDDQCCSGYCRAGHCGQPPNPATCHQTGEDCMGNVDNCCDGITTCRANDNSLGYTTCCMEASERCNSNLDCCGEMTCLSGRCNYVSGTDPCADHLDCPPGLSCIEGRCELGMCHTYNQTCFSDAADDKGCCPGLLCFYDASLRVDHCVLQIGSGLCTGDGQACTDSGECCFPSICNSQNVCEDFISCAFPGASCTSDSQCCSGTCLGGACTEITPTCAEAGQLCGAAFGACCGGLNCTNGRCAATSCAADGARCSGPSGCCSGRCTAGICGSGQPPGCIDDGSGCASPLDCCSGRCSGGSCVPNTTSCAGSGAACGPSAACCTGLTCSNGTCAAPSGSCEGQSCSGGSCCGSAPHCTSNSGGIFVWQCHASCGVRGVFCQDSADCCSGLVCQGQECGDPRPCTGRACSGGGDCCDHDAYCVANQCAQSCGSRGATCGDDFDCCSTTCTNDRCE